MMSRGIARLFGAKRLVKPFPARACCRRFTSGIVALFVAIALQLPGTARASYIDLNAYSFGANQSIIATLGQISYITGCSPGVDDFIYPAGDVYISAGGPGPDVSGAPNTLVYVVIDEVIGNTGPGGNIPSGNYTVWVDECQDGTYQAGQDSIVANISVLIPSNIDPLSSAQFAASLASTKAAATQQQNHWAQATAYYAGLFAVFNAITAVSIATDLNDFLLFACTNVNLDTGQLECSLEKAWGGLLGLELGVLTTIANQAFYYKGIAADPPDSNFTEPPVLDAGLEVTTVVDNPLQQQVLQFGEIASQGTSLAHALLTAMERYQGAEQAGMGEYAYLQAKYAEQYARELANAIPRVNAAFMGVATAAEASGIDFVSIMDDYRAMQTQAANSGPTAVQRAELISAGWTDQNIADGIADLLSRDFSGLTTATDLSTLAAAMAADEAAAVTALTSFADDMATEQASLDAQLNMPFPVADAGGPYVVDEGTAIALDASASTHPTYTSNQLSYAWDLNLDGVFDDATGQTPTVTINHEMDGYIGVQVTAPTGFKDVAYARMTVNNVNSAPEVTSATPAGEVTIPFDGAQTFSVTAIDPDSDPLSYSWDLDGVTVGGSGASYSYTASMPDVGEHIVTVIIADNSPLSPDTTHFWRMSVTAPDNDGDGFPSNIDCNDSNPDVNPGVSEVYLNGIDDDCDPATPDDPDADNDGYDYTVDCDETNPAINPGADEICNGIDDNCDGSIDEGFDADGDGVSICAGDCNDTDASIYPGAAEICNLIDDNCDGSVDEGFDVDGDGVTVCGGDCNDADAAIYPGATEICNLIDDNCDSSIDEGFDLDGDGVTTCGGDCDDTAATTYPGAPEICDSVDNNCNGSVDEGVNDDFDGDGVSICAGDCNDANASIFPGATETCNNIDDNCDGTVDDGFDVDGDGFSICALPVSDCDDANADAYPGRPEVFHNGIDDDCDATTPDDYAETFIIVTDDNGRIYYARSNGDGTWADYRELTQLSGSIRGAAIADYDNDGDLDFTVGSPSGNTTTFYLFLNDGSDNFTNIGSVGTGDNASSYQMDMTAGDFNNDGNMDFLGNTNNRYIHQAMGDGQGHFTITTIDLGVGNGRGLDAADFNHDGFLDYARVTYSTGEIIVYLGDGTGNFTSAGVIGDSGTDPYGLTAADFNNDGHVDVLANEGSSGSATLFPGNGDGTFGAGIAVPSVDFNNHGGYDNYDFNRDGNQDLVASSYTSRIIRYYPGNGDGTFGAEVQVNPSTTPGNIMGISAPPTQPPPGDPVAFISPNPVNAGLGATVNLSGQFSTDDGSIVSYAWDFDDTTTDSGVDVSHAFPAVEKDYRVKLQVTDNDGNVGSGNSLVRIMGAPPVADASGPYTFGEAFANGGVYTVQLDGSASSDDGPVPVQYQWDLGNGVNESFNSSTIHPGLWASGLATVSGAEAVVTGVRSWETAYLVTNLEFPRVVGDSYTTRISINNGGGPDNYVVWGLKNTNTSYNQSQFPYAIYFYNGTLRIYENGSYRGGFGSYSQNTSYDMRIDLKPSGATYYFRQTGAPSWSKIYDSDYSNESPLRFGVSVWSGEAHVDNLVSTSQTSDQELPTVTYPRQGLYNIALTVTDGVGQTDTDLTTVNLVAGAPPVANPGGPYTPGEDQANCNTWTVVFDGTASTDDNGIYQYNWDFGDGSTGNGASPSHTYAAPGTYTVTLTVVDHALQTHSASTTVTTTPGAPPVANPGGPYAVDESAATAGMWTVNFDGTGSTDDNGLCDYVWDFGDGNTGSGASPTHEYAAVGTYTVSLTVRDHAHQSHTMTTTVEVTANDAPVADHGGPYAVDENQALNGQWTASFDATASTDDFGIWTYNWDFGDGGTGSGATPTHVYDAPGTYDVTLTVTDNGRQTNVITTQITVSGNNPPVADAGPARVTEVGMPVVLDASGSTDDFGISGYQWDFDVATNWDMSGALIVPGGEVVIDGTNTWGNRYLVTQNMFARNDGDSYTGRIVSTSSSGNHRMMWGLKTDNTSFTYTQFPYAIYFNNGDIAIYEGGGNRGSFGSFSYDTSYDLRIDLKATGATYYYRETGAPSWTLLYDSTYSTASPLRFGATINAGGFQFSDFSAAGTGLNLPVAGSNTVPVISASYSAVGTYHPAVTVTDHAQQTNTDTTTVTVLLGNPPVADSGGPYLTNEMIPTRFNARGSSDDFGIRYYEWDFGDGTSFTTSNPFVDHIYTTEGSYTATLTVTDFAGQSASTSTTVNVSPDPVVAAVPWAFSGGLEIPHDTWSGKQITLKAVAWTKHLPVTFTWNFGDGSAPVSGSTSNPYYDIQANHTYTGVEGAPFIATVTVTDANGQTATDQYLVRIRAHSQDIEINIAIDNGLWYLHRNQTRSESGNALFGQWQYSSYVNHATGSATQAFEINAHRQLGDVREDPYVETVTRGLNTLFSRLVTQDMTMQAAGDPDSNGNTIGLSVDGGRPIYEGGMVMDAIASSGTVDVFTDAGNLFVRHRSYKDVLQDMVDQFSWGQYDNATVGGGWRYAWNQAPDNSAAQWGAIGILAAQHTFGLDAPQWVKDENNVWLNYSFNGSGFGYTTASTGQATTPSGLVQMVLDGADRDDPRWVAAEAWISDRWSANSYYTNSPTQRFNNYYALFALTKAMRLALPNAITNLRGGAQDGLDWFNDPTLGVAATLIEDSFASNDGSFAGSGSWVNQPTRTAWGVIMLTRALFVQPPVADAGSDRVWGVDVPLTLDGSGSFHLDPFRDIVTYEWDIDGDGIYDTSSTDPTVQVTYSSQDYPEATLPRNITVRLRVTDNNDPAITDTDTAVITIAVPPHPPIADAGGPYSCTQGLPCVLDGSASFDIDPTDFISSWEWDLDGDFVYDNATGETPSVIFNQTGVLNIGLRVLDNAVLNDVNGNGVQDPEERLEDFDFTTVTVTSNNPPVADAGADQVINEGDTANLDGTGSSDPDGNPLTYTWDLDNDGLYDDATGPTPSFAGVDDGVYTIGLKVSDGLLDSTDTMTVTVNNVIPAVNAGPDQTVNEGDTVSLAPATFTDPGTLDTHTAMIDWGDGSTPEAGVVTEVNGNGGVAGSHLYVDNGSYTVTVTVTDDDTGTGSDTLLVTVGNLPPVVEAGPNASIIEGDTVTLAPATFTDAGDLDTHTATIDWGDGSTPDAGVVTEANGDGSVAGSHSFPNSGTYTVTVTVTDKDGDSGSDTFQVQVGTGNVAPIANAGGPYIISEGDNATLDGSASSDANGDSLSYAWDLDNDGLYDDATGPTANFAGLDDGVYTVGLMVSDGQLDNTDSTTVTVNNVAPAVNAGPDQTVNEGDTVSLAPATFTDPGTLDTHIAMIDWGDGSAPEAGAVTEADGNGSVAGSHVYPTSGSYTVTVTVTDDDEGVGSDTLLVTVQATEVPPEQTIFDLYARAKDTKIDVVWTPVSGASGYNIYRSTTQGGPYTLIAAGHVTNYAVYVDTGLTQDVTYYYVVTSIVNGQESLFSNEASATPTARVR